MLEFLDSFGQTNRQTWLTTLSIYSLTHLPLYHLSSILRSTTPNKPSQPDSLKSKSKNQSRTFTYRFWIASSFPCFSLTSISIFVWAVETLSILDCSSLRLLRDCSNCCFSAERSHSSFCVVLMSNWDDVSSSSFSAFRMSLSIPCSRLPEAATLFSSVAICRIFLLFSSYNIQIFKVIYNFACLFLIHIMP